MVIKNNLFRWIVLALTIVLTFEVLNAFYTGLKVGFSSSALLDLTQSLFLFCLAYFFFIKN